MPEMLNPFTATGFDMVAMTAAMTKLPNLYNRLGPIFGTGSGITTTSVAIEQMNGTLNIVRSRPRGAPADKPIMDKRALRIFAVPHIPLEDVLLPEDYQSVRAFGSTSAMETQAGIMLRKLTKMRNAIDQTREHLRMGALKGVILDADGSTMYNLYTEFGITVASAAGDVGKYLTVDFALDDEDTDVRAKCADVLQHIEMNLRGETMSGVRVLVDNTFYKALVSHPKVEKAFSQYVVLNQNLASDYRQRFEFGGLTFEVYSATWTDKDGTSRLAIASGEGHAFPEGTGNTFEEVFAPGNFLETANTVGLPYYAKQEPRKFNAGIDIWAESNPLPICKRPEILVKVTA